MAPRLRHRVSLRVVAEESDRPSRPVTRGDCQDGPRPCPWVSCRYHLALDVTMGGSIRISPSLVDGDPRGTKRMRTLGEGEEFGVDEWLEEAAELVVNAEHTCSLDLSEQGGKTLDEVGAAMGLTRERTRQVESAALIRARKAGHQ